MPAVRGPKPPSPTGQQRIQGAAESGRAELGSVLPVPPTSGTENELALHGKTKQKSRTVSIPSVGTTDFVYFETTPRSHHAVCT